MAVKLPKAPLREILREQGGKRVSGKGLEEYRSEIERYAYALAEMTVLCAKHGKRMTVLPDDVQLAVR